MKVRVIGSNDSHLGFWVTVAFTAKPPTLKVEGSLKVNPSPILNSWSTRGSVKFGGVVESCGGGVFEILRNTVWFCLKEG